MCVCVCGAIYSIFTHLKSQYIRKQYSSRGVISTVYTISNIIKTYLPGSEIVKLQLYCQQEIQMEQTIRELALQAVTRFIGADCTNSNSM